MPRVTITHEFDANCEQFEISTLMQSSNFQSLLIDIDNELRGKIKHGENSWLDEDTVDYLQSLRDMISESGVMLGE